MSISHLNLSTKPKVFAFDLDGTVWSPDMYELWGGGGSPFEPVDNATKFVKDCAGSKGKWKNRNDLKMNLFLFLFSVL